MSPGQPGQRSLAASLVFAMLASLGVAGCWYSEAPKELTAVSWGGCYTEASVEAYYRPFEESTGFTVRQMTYSGGLDEIRQQVTSGDIVWDVVDLEIFDAVRGCNEGLLEPIPWVMLAPAADGTPAEEDFLEDTTTECGVGASVYSTIYAYDEERFPGEKPTTVADFFDIARFPGRRGIRLSPQVNLEFALMADGVPPEEVYDALRTPAGQERAFRKLEGLRDHIRWWVAADEPVEMLAAGEVVNVDRVQRPDVSRPVRAGTPVHHRLARLGGGHRPAGDCAWYAAAPAGVPVRAARLHR